MAIALVLIVINLALAGVISRWRCAVNETTLKFHAVFVSSGAALYLTHPAEKFSVYLLTLGLVVGMTNFLTLATNGAVNPLTAEPLPPKLPRRRHGKEWES